MRCLGCDPDCLLSDGLFPLRVTDLLAVRGGGGVPRAQVPRSWALNLLTWPSSVSLRVQLSGTWKREGVWAAFPTRGRQHSWVVTGMVEMGSGPTVSSGREVASASVGRPGAGAPCVTGARCTELALAGDSRRFSALSCRLSPIWEGTGRCVFPVARSIL